MEQNDVQNVQDTRKKWSKKKKIAVWTSVGVAAAGIATAVVFLIRKIKKS